MNLISNFLKPRERNDALACNEDQMLQVDQDYVFDSAVNLATTAGS